jgi:hypothetical protein
MADAAQCRPQLNSVQTAVTAGKVQHSSKTDTKIEARAPSTTAGRTAEPARDAQGGGRASACWVPPPPPPPFAAPKLATCLVPFTKAASVVEAFSPAARVALNAPLVKFVTVPITPVKPLLVAFLAPSKTAPAVEVRLPAASVVRLNVTGSKGTTGQSHTRPCLYG